MPSMKETLAKRLVPAIVITIVTGSVLIGVVGAGNATEEEAPVDAIDVPRAMLGDAGSYSLEVHGPWPAGPFTDRAASFLNFSFELGEPTRMSDGLVHETDRVALTGTRLVPYRLDNDLDGEPDGNAWEPYLGAVVFEQGTSTVLAMESNRTLMNATEGGVLGTGFSVKGGPVPLESQVITHERSRQRDFEASGPACLFVNPLQGRVADLDSRFALDDVCEIGSLLEIPPGPFRASAFEDVGPLTALRFDGLLPAVHADSTTVVAMGSIGQIPDVDVNITVEFLFVSMWFAPGIASPVKVEARSQEGSYLSMVLVGYEAGSTPRTPGPAPRDPLPPLAYAPMQPWGPDDAGLVTDLLPSEAWNAANTDPSFTGLRNFMADHPRAYTISSARIDFGGPAWWFTLSDGESEYSFIAESIAATGLPPPFPKHLFDYTDFGGPSDTYATPVPPEPDEVPTWVALADRWRRYASPDEAAHDANRFLYVTLCVGDGNDRPCDWAVDIAEAGWVEATVSAQRLDTSTQPPTVVRDEQLRMSELSMVNGKATLLRTAQEDTTVRDGLPGSGSSTPSGAPASRPAGGLLPAWFPSPEQAAGISFVGIAAGALYWIWPVLKGGVVGLFSRVRSPELLQNPQRARIAAIVEAEPGIHFQELGRRSSIPNGTLVHHLGKLTHAGLVVARPYGGYTCYFPKSAGRIQMAAAPAMKSDGARAILAAVAAQPGLTSQQVAEHCRLQASTVTYHVKRLIEGGLVVASRDGRFVRLHPSPTAITMAGQAAAASA